MWRDMQAARARRVRGGVRKRQTRLVPDFREQRNPWLIHSCRLPLH
jgi:hypothetical protein